MPGAATRRLLLLAAVAGCADAATAPPPPPRPAVLSAQVAAVPASVLAAVVTVTAAGAESVAVRFGEAGAALDRAAPAVPAGAGPVAVPVLGLRPGTAYRLRAVAIDHADSAFGDTLRFTTGPLPDDLPGFVAGGPAPGPGFVAFSTGQYGVVIDNEGRVAWYVRFPGGPSLNFQAQPNGRYVARPAPADPSADVPLLEFNVLGEVTRELACTGGLRTRFHDVLVERDGGYWLLCDETRVMDLSAIGGSPAAAVTGTVVQHRDAAGGLVFSWSTFDHFELTDLPAEGRSGTAVNWTHGNALDLDGDGFLYLSFRSLSEVTKVDTRTGAVAWRLGGLRNQFALPGAGAPFSRQHGVRVTPGGAIYLLDNLGHPEGSRAERWIVDPGAGIATLTGIYSPSPATRAELGGTTQPLDGRLLVAYGNGGRLEEYDADGRKAWEVMGDAGYVFRAQRIRSLYHPEEGLAR